MPTKFGLALTVILFIVVIVVLHWEDNFSGSAVPQEIIKANEDFIQRLTSALQRPDLKRITVNVLSRDGGSYGISYILKNQPGQSYISLTGYGKDTKNFQDVSKLIIGILKKRGIKVKGEEPKAMGLPEFYLEISQTINLLRGADPQKLLEAFKRYLMHFTILNLRLEPSSRILNEPGRFFISKNIR